MSMDVKCPNCGQCFAPSANPHPGTYDFEAVYLLFPRKGAGKKVGMDRCRRMIRSEKKYQSLLEATRNYALLVRREKTEMKYIMQFSTFMNRWEDYLLPECEPLVATESRKEEKLLSPQDWSEFLGS